MKLKEIIFASNNISKAAELKPILEVRGITLKTLNEVGLTNFDIEETGSTYAENAKIKAHAVFNILGKPVISDDSGVEVEYLNNAPGVYTHRWIGNEDCCQKMLRELEGVDKSHRKARYVTNLCYTDGVSDILIDSYIDGYICGEARGDKSFAFDPIFIPDGETLTFAEMTLEHKNTISARGKAISSLMSIICAEAEFKHT